MSGKEKVNAWITWPDDSKYGWYNCQLVLENGWPIYGHLCSSPGFALGDLWADRTERKAEWERAGLELNIVAEVPQSEVPDHVFDNNKNEAYVTFAKKHFPHYSKKKEENSTHPKISITVTNETINEGAK